ncbi:MAG: hypothetical protein AAFZ92_10065, partial [Pseudomonadota bacterium]
LSMPPTDAGKVIAVIGDKGLMDSDSLNAWVIGLFDEMNYKDAGNLVTQLAPEVAANILNQTDFAVSRNILAAASDRNRADAILYSGALNENPATENANLPTDEQLELMANLAEQVGKGEMTEEEAHYAFYDGLFGFEPGTMAGEATGTEQGQRQTSTDEDLNATRGFVESMWNLSNNIAGIEEAVQGDIDSIMNETTFNDFITQRDTLEDILEMVTGGKVEEAEAYLSDFLGYSKDAAANAVADMRRQLTLNETSAPSPMPSPQPSPASEDSQPNYSIPENGDPVDLIAGILINFQIRLKLNESDLFQALKQLLPGFNLQAIFFVAAGSAGTEGGGYMFENNQLKWQLRIRLSIDDELRQHLITCINKNKKQDGADIIDQMFGKAGEENAVDLRFKITTVIKDGQFKHRIDAIQLVYFNEVYAAPDQVPNAKAGLKFGTVAMLQLFMKAGFMLYDTYNILYNSRVMQSTLVNSALEMADVKKQEVDDAILALDEAVFNQAQSANFENQAAVLLAAKRVAQSGLTLAQVTERLSQITLDVVATGVDEKTAGQVINEENYKAFEKAAQAAIDALQAVDPSTYADTISLIQNSLLGASTYFSRASSALKNIPTFFQWLKDKLVNGFNSIPDAFSGAPSALSDAVLATPQAIASTFKGLLDAFKNSKSILSNDTLIKLTWLNENTVKRDQKGDPMPFTSYWDGDALPDLFTFALYPFAQVSQNKEWGSADNPFGKLTSRFITQIGAEIGFDLALTKAGKAKNKQDIPLEVGDG